MSFRRQTNDDRDDDQTSYYGEPREIALVMAGVNRGNGYPWFAFAHRKVEAEA